MIISKKTSLALIFQCVEATKKTERRVENKRAHFGAASPVSVNTTFWTSENDMYDSNEKISDPSILKEKKKFHYDFLTFIRLHF